MIMKLRIKKTRDKADLIFRYRVQKRWGLFFWESYGESVGMWIRSKSFSTLQKAEEHLQEIKEFENK